MTAVVGILNKQAVAIAADSAVTISGVNGRKIFNKANKVFALSKCHPVGIMIYNSATFMGTPWETIIKVYRKQLNDKSFNTVKEYEEDFIQYLKDREFYTTPEMQLNSLEIFTVNIINSVINDIMQRNKILLESPNDESRELFLKQLEAKVDEVIQNFNNPGNICSEFTDYSFDNFMTYSNELFEKIVQLRFTNNQLEISDALRLKVKQMVYNVLLFKEENFSFTGLIFTGFGESEIYPQLIAMNVSMVVDNRLRFYHNEGRSASISNSSVGAICPFAQTDVIDTILTGVDPKLNAIYLKNFEQLFQKYNQTILDSIGDPGSLLYQQIQALHTNDILQEYNKMNEEIKREEYISPLMNAVSNLAKEDLAEMAESLIYLTYLKRRITFTEESVGGPVDVAIISKGDGFVWIKRKHYFAPELNQHFFDNYFKP